MSFFPVVDKEIHQNVKTAFLYSMAIYGDHLMSDSTGLFFTFLWTGALQKKVPLYVQYLLNGDCDLWGALWRSFSSQTCPVNRPNCPKQVRTEKTIQNQFCFASPKLLLFCNGRHLFLLIHQCSSPCGHKPVHHLTLPRSYNWRDEMSSASNKGICVPVRLRKKANVVINDP